MKLHFTKMQGAGNDFIVIDQVTQEIEFNQEWVKLLASRKLGVGCDQLLLLEPPRSKEADFFYRIFNADGTEVEQCGNGARCLGQYIINKQLSPKASWEIETINSKLTVAMAPNNQGIRVNLGKPNFNASSLPFNFNEKNVINNYLFNLEFQDSNYKNIQFSVVSIGNPHVVINLDDLKIDHNNENLITNLINKIGKFFNNHPQFPSGVNVNFVRIIDTNNLVLITYERGVGITLACGSGACAATVCARKLEWIKDNNITIENKGGVLKVNWGNTEDSSVWLTGPTSTVFEGYINI